MDYTFAPPITVSVPVVGSNRQFPVHRIYCVGRNYEEHAKEMGHSGREAPFFFIKPADTIVYAAPGTMAHVPYPSMTANLHHEIELVVAIGTGGRNIAAADAAHHIYGYAVGLDMTRRDLQNEMKKQGRPWCIGKGFDHSAPIGSITPASDVIGIDHASISLTVNGQRRQTSTITQLIWNVAETIEQLSLAWELQPGDLIFTGTPAGVGAVVAGDVMQGDITGLSGIAVAVVAA